MVESNLSGVIQAVVQSNLNRVIQKGDQKWGPIEKPKIKFEKVGQ